MTTPATPPRLDLSKATDDEINAAVARIAGWKPTEGDIAQSDGWEQITGERIPPETKWPRYLDDASAVVPLLAKCEALKIDHDADGPWRVSIWSNEHDDYCHGSDSSFCRAVCFALLRVADVASGRY